MLLFALLPPVSNRTSLYRAQFLLVAAAAMVCRLCGQAGHSVRTCKFKNLKFFKSRKAVVLPVLGGCPPRCTGRKPRSSTLVPAGVPRKASWSDREQKKDKGSCLSVFSSSPFCFLSFHDAGWSLRNRPPGRCAEAARRGLPPQPLPAAQRVIVDTWGTCSSTARTRRFWGDSVCSGTANPASTS